MTRSDMVNLMAMLTRAGIDFSARFNVPSTVRVAVDGGVVVFVFNSDDDELVSIGLEEAR